MDFVKKLFSSDALRPWFIVSLIANMGIIITGAIVRLTGSGLGCPTWPKCTDSSYVPHGEVTYHAFIEFSNRLLTFVLLIAAIGALVTSYRGSSDRRLRAACWGVLAGIGAQIIVGGITVVYTLNPYLVGIHLILSVALVVVCAWALALVVWPEPTEISALGRTLSRVTFAIALVVIYIGTLVTGSGPNSGDENAARTGFDIESVARIHSLSAWALVAATIATVIVLTKSGASLPATFAQALLAIIVLQGIGGYVQYFTHLPVGVVISHMVGTAVIPMLVTFLVTTSKVVKI